ncbi:translocation/assembly module TamB domain-containing protein [Candidatus Manganitrophus noduliformans]|uniref:Translocation/assembly module TamB n=1 Tax=Candidatus Manganitrophus noduliformans TaxID=2606439 RepID=A0A7X6IDA0_9BACT|nr:translocation/assembly module TamB domain-containing protein [Candidatus Manganitrophus noduliformans]NKE73224.1 translocation/assembly module TamB [Candidatus Manganitrophus noduliformans]
MRYRWLWFIPLLLILFLGLGAVLLVATELGARWLLAQAGRFVPGKLEIEQVDGTLLGPLTLKGVAYVDETRRLSIGAARLAWRPAHLLGGELSIELLSIEGVDYEQDAEETPPPETGGSALPSIDLPIRVVVSKATLDDITFTSGDQTVTVDHVALAGRMDEQGLRIESLRVEAPQFAVSLSGKVDPRGAYPFDLSADWSADLLPDASLRGKGEAKGTLGKFALRHQLTAPFSIDTQGTVRLEEGTPVVDLTGSWSKAQWPLTEEAMIESHQGTYQFSGPIDDYRFRLQADLRGPQFPETLWEIEGTGSQKMATVREVAVRTLDGEITGKGEIAWAPEVRWALALDGSTLNPGARWPEWNGRITFHLNTEGKLTDAGPVGTFQLDALQGELRGYPVRAQADLKVDGEAYEIEALELHSGSARLTAAGEVSDRWDLRWKIQAPDLAALLPDAGGRLAGSGRIRGARSLPAISAEVRGEGLRWAETKIKQLRLKGSVDLQGEMPSSIDIDVEGVEAAGETITRIEVEGKGLLSSHALQADARTRDQRIFLRMEGGVEGKRWKGALRRSALQDKALGNWILDTPVPMILSADAADVDMGCWHQETARFCIAGAWQQEQGWQTEGRAEQIPLDLIKSWLPSETTLSGALDGEWRASQRDGRLQFKTRWIPQPGTLVYNVTEEEMLRFPYEDALFQAELEDQTLHAEARLTLTGHGGLQGVVTLSPFDLDADWREGRLDGTVKASLDRLEPITALIPNVTQSGGELRINFALGGTPTDPQVTGEATLQGGTVRIAALGITLDPLRLAIRSRDPGTLLIDAEAGSGPGRINVNGTIAMDADRGWPARLSIRGERFEAVDLPEVHLLASPDLTLEVLGRRIELTGEVFIPEAEITPRELPEGAVQVSEDVVIVRAPSGKETVADAAQGWEIHTRVRIRLGEEISFNGFGLTGKITGELLATDAPDQPTLAEGTLRIEEGKYQAYGQKLEITEGRLIFAGPTDNPGLDIRAVRKVEEITAGIHVSGTLKRPQSTLFSDPPMDEANTLSYLLLGRPLNQASGEEGDLMTKAIAALGVRGGNLLAKRIGRTLGLDDVRLEGGETIEETTLVIGRYLSPRFYVSYGIGLFEAANTLSLRYTISEKLTLRAQSGEESSLDLLYTREYE